MTTATDVADALTGRRGAVAIRHRFERRTKVNAFVDDISTGVVRYSGGITLDNTRPVARTLSVELRPALLPSDFDPDSDIIGAYAEIFAGGLWTRYPMGLFQLDSWKDVRSASEIAYQVTGSDLMTLLYEQGTEDTYTVAAGTRYVDAITRILDRFGLQYTMPSINTILPVAMTWNVGAQWGAMANDLAEGMGAFYLWADENGFVTTRALVDPFLESASVAYTTDAEPRMIRPGFTRSYDRSRFPNRIVMQVKDPTRDAYSIAYVNDDDDSPISTLARGTQTQQVSGDRMANTAVMDTVGSYLLRDASCQAQQARILTHPDPRRTNREFYSVTVQGAEYATLWQARGWRYSFALGETMQHDIGRVSKVDVSRVML